MRGNGCDLLRQALRRTGDSQAKCAARIGVDRSRLHRLLNGQGRPTLREGVLLDQTYQVPASAWLDDLPQESKDDKAVDEPGVIAYEFGVFG